MALQLRFLQSLVEVASEKEFDDDLSSADRFADAVFLKRTSHHKDRDQQIRNLTFAEQSRKGTACRALILLRPMDLKEFDYKTARIADRCLSKPARARSGALAGAVSSNRRGYP